MTSHYLKMYQCLFSFLHTEKKSPARKRKAPSATKDTSKSKRQKKEKNPPLKAALVDTDGYSIPKIKIGRFTPQMLS